jgi:hypothetical protein
MTSISHHQLAAISIVGSFLDVLGALYLAYDILGGKHGPLRTLTRMVTYGVLFGAGYGLPLGLAFGIAAGAANGITLALEFSRMSKEGSRYPYRYEVLFSIVRGIGFGAGSAWTHGAEFGAIFGTLCAAGQIAGYRMGMHPGMYGTGKRTPSINWRSAGLALVRTVGYGVAGSGSAAIVHHEMHAVMFGEAIGLATGVLTALINFLAPYIEWLSDNMPDRRMGVAGVVLILSGFGLQSVQYWVALLDVQVR